MRTGKVTRDGFTSFLLSCCFEEVGGATGSYGRDAIVGHQTENQYLQKSAKYFIFGTVSGIYGYCKLENTAKEWNDGPAGEHTGQSKTVTKS